MKRIALILALIIPGCAGGAETLEGRTSRLHRQYNFPKNQSEKDDAISEMRSLVADCRRELWRSDPQPSFIEKEARRYIEAGWLIAIMLKDPELKLRSEAYEIAADAFRIHAPLVFQDFDAAIRRLADLQKTAKPEEVQARATELATVLDSVAGNAVRVQAIAANSTTYQGVRGEGRILAAVAAELVRRHGWKPADDLPDRLHQVLPDETMKDKAVYVWLDLAFLHEKLGHKEKARALYSQALGADSAKEFQRTEARAGLERLKD